MDDKQKLEILINAINHCHDVYNADYIPYKNSNPIFAKFDKMGMGINDFKLADIDACLVVALEKIQ